MDYPQAIVSIVMLCVCVLLGLPVWWNTTKVYRATLPHARIEELQNIDITLKIGLHFIGNEYTDSEIDWFREYISQYKAFQFVIEKSKSEKKLDIDIEGFDGICNSFSGNQHNKKLQFTFVLVQSKKEQFSYYCQLGFTYIVSPGLNGNLIDLLKTLIDEILPMKEIEAYEPSVKSKADVTKSLRLATGYNLVFTLAVASPTYSVPRWNIKQVISTYLDPILEKLDFLGPFHVSSQILYFADVGIKPRESDNEGYFFYTKSKLPLILNPLESRLNTYTSTYAGLNFIVYVPPPKNTPLYIKSTASSLKKSKAFHSPRWGGIVFHNDDTNMTNGEIDASGHMKTFITQFFLLNGLNLEKTRTIFDKNTKEPLTESICTRLRVLKTFENLRTSISTLSSLSILLDNIANIVIRDEIKALIEHSVRKIDSALLSMRNGDIASAIVASKDAYDNSEKAFYDWSLLALLYFSDDQKYAIYVPLFLPISLPVFISFVKSVRWLRSKEKID